MDNKLLPSGLYDQLPPAAHRETAMVASLLAAFEAFGYEQVNPPLLEFEETLLSGRGAALAPQTFRLMDPQSGRMMGLRADMTMQIARIAQTILAKAPRPLRLCYAGSTLQVSGEALRTERQQIQAGIELIGCASPQADAEVILASLEALERTGVTAITVDLNLPSLLELIIPNPTPAILEAMAMKDTTLLRRYAGESADLLTSLINTAGPAGQTLIALRKLPLPGKALVQIDALEQVVKQLEASTACNISIDPAERRGFEYHHGISFCFFAQGAASELGRGGRYLLENGSEATGSTIYVNRLTELSLNTRPQQSHRRIYIPVGSDESLAKNLRSEGYATIYAQTGSAEEQEAKRLGCAGILKSAKIQELKE